MAMAMRRPRWWWCDDGRVLGIAVGSRCCAGVRRRGFGFGIRDEGSGNRYGRGSGGIEDLETVFPHPNLNSNFNSRQALGDSVATTLASLSDSTTSSTNSAVVSSRLASTYPQCNKQAKSDSLWVIASCCYSDIDSFPSGTSCNPYLPISSLRDSSPLPAEHLVRRTPSANGSFISKKPSLRKANDSPSQSGKQISESLLRPAPSCLLSQANNTLDNPTQ
ncbi:hypothetical protein MRB53_020561 [Persea americana]|uniref:Uncharacterized protein n=1 Tax=Persea americana TaxID=3435 RepID=A0ACC2L2J0_PERAE|nr:hypothetical protein MRB53_020561 [Persea americana]